MEDALQLGLNIYFSVSAIPDINSVRSNAREDFFINDIRPPPYAPGFGSQSNAISAPAVRATQSSENGRNTFQPRRIS